MSKLPKSAEIEVTPIPAFKDNYIWMLHSQTSDRAWVVDPGESKPVRDWLSSQNKTLQGILLTHHHRDHIGGVPDLLSLTDNVYGPALEPIAETRFRMQENDYLNVLGHSFRVLDIPGHTNNHIGWFCSTTPNAPLLFCGDTLFSAGCGRLLGGTASQLFDSLSRLKSLPDDTLVYCTHEYTRANLIFASTVDPHNRAASDWLQKATELRNRGEITLPTTIKAEKQYNPFLRTETENIQRSIAQYCGFSPSGPEQAFAELRLWKDRF
jgi:hydroxyacylglutathione hydrolase